MYPGVHASPQFSPISSLRWGFALLLHTFIFTLVLPNTPSRRTLPPRDADGRFRSNRSVSYGVQLPTPSSLAGAAFEASSDSDSTPSLSSELGFSTHSSPIWLNTELGAAETEGIPFPPSPIPQTEAPLNPSVPEPETPTQTRVRRTATRSAPSAPSPDLLARLQQTITTSQSASGPTPADQPVMSNKNEDLRAARTALSKLEPFDDEGVPMREAEWRHQFTIATRDVTDAERAQLWADKLAFEGEAYEWLGSQKTTQAGRDAAKDWNLLLPLIEARWPTPKRDQSAWAEQLRTRWRTNYLDVGLMVAELADPSCATRPHEAWARQHLAWGRACGSTDADLVYHTLNESLPSWVIPLLPKKRRYNDAFTELCTDLGEIPSRDLYDAYNHSLTMLLLVSNLQANSISPEPTPVAPLTPRPSALRRTPATSALLPPATPVQPTTIPPPFPNSLPPRSAPRTPQVGFSPRNIPGRLEPFRQQPPHIAAPPMTPVPVAAPPSTTNATPQRTTPVLRDPMPALVAENTPSALAHHKALVTQWEERYGTLQPSITRPYPLSPGTFEQTRDICVKCGRGVHTALQCTADPAQVLPEHERQMRGAILRSLKPPGQWGRAGAVPGTPTPAQRFTRDTSQLEEEPDFDDSQTDYYVSENEEGR